MIHPLVVDILVEVFNLLNSGKHVVLAWVPSHVGIPGNEKADQTAKSALSTLCLTPESLIRILVLGFGNSLEIRDRCCGTSVSSINCVLFSQYWEWKGGS